MDSAQASEKLFQACKLSLINYLKKLERDTEIEIVPKTVSNQWSYKKFTKLTRLIRKKVDEELAAEIVSGWTQSYIFHTRGWSQNDLTVIEVEDALPKVMRFIDIIEKELKVEKEMAIYLKKHLFQLDLDQMANEIHEHSKTGNISLIFQSINMQKDLRKQLNIIYQNKYGEDLTDVLLKNQKGCREHFS
ncbi:unnamed protein product [Auanema sp. JU1783]|nr:unnamed protein product [Auanema sp. JU1783]